MKTQGQVLGLVLAGQAMRGPVLMKNTWESRKVKRKNIKKHNLKKLHGHLDSKELELKLFGPGYMLAYISYILIEVGPVYCTSYISGYKGVLSPLTILSWTPFSKTDLWESPALVAPLGKPATLLFAVFLIIL